MKILRGGLLALLLCLGMLVAGTTVLASGAVSSDGTFKGIRLCGKVRVVEYNPDIRVQVVTSFPGLG